MESLQLKITKPFVALVLFCASVITGALVIAVLPFLLLFGFLFWIGYEVIDWARGYAATKFSK